MKIKLALMVSFVVLSANAENMGNQWFFTTTVGEKSVLSVKENEFCRKWAFEPNFIKDKCMSHRNGFLCKGDSESFIVSSYKSEAECKKFLNKARKVVESSNN